MTNTWEELEKLEKNWDRYKADPITPTAIEKGKMLESLISLPIQFFPSPDGGVDFEWTRKVGDDWETLIIEISPEGEVGIFLG